LGAGCASSGDAATSTTPRSAPVSAGGEGRSSGERTATTTGAATPSRSLSGTGALSTTAPPQGSAPATFDVERARAVFGRTCAACHGARGQGIVGPNLTDGVGIHPVTDVSGYEALVRDGVPARGMPGWGRALSLEEVSLVAQLAWSLRNTNDPEGKAPQGEHTLP
jgi:mono/diheme cytochrome c family protein